MVLSAWTDFGGAAPLPANRPTALGPRVFDAVCNDEGTLASLSDVVLSSRFCAWRGASDRRYVASVYAVESDAMDSGLPAFEKFVLMAVARGVLGRRIVAVAAIEQRADRKAAQALGLARGAQEWHVHLIAEDRRARLAMVADLRERHGGVADARCA